MANYKLSKLATEDIRRIYEYGILTFGVDIADKYFDALMLSFDDIAKNPLIYAPLQGMEEECRRCVSGSDNIYYEIVGDTVLIVRVIGRQDLRSAF